MHLMVTMDLTKLLNFHSIRRAAITVASAHPGITTHAIDQRAGLGGEHMTQNFYKAAIFQSDDKVGRILAGMLLY